MTYLLCDVGGTKTRVGISRDHRQVDEVRSCKTPATPEKAVAEIATLANELGIENPTASAIALRGRLNVAKTGIENDVVLTKWAGVDFAALIKKQFGIIPLLENDTALAGLGEAVHGAGQGLDIVVYHTISTGVGGVKIEEGIIDDASHGFEPGHQFLDIDRTILGEDVSPTLENLVSGSAVAERFGVKAYEIPQDDIVWDELAEYLAQGLRNTILYWSPDAIVLGGAMMVGDPAIPIDAVRKYTVEALDGFVEAPYITLSTLKDDAGIYGALALLNSK